MPSLSKQLRAVCEQHAYNAPTFVSGAIARHYEQVHISLVNCRRWYLTSAVSNLFRKAYFPVFTIDPSQYTSDNG